MKKIKDNNLQHLKNNQKNKMAFKLLNKGFEILNLLLWGN